MAALCHMITRLADLTLRLSEIGPRGSALTFEPDEAARAEMARTLDLLALPCFSATVEVQPWFDGAAIRGRWSARVTQTCGVSLEPFETPLSGDFTVHVVPPGSPNAPALGAEVDLDPEADDPPDLLESETLDLGAYLVEHLSLEIDPFPRKPGAVFEPPETGGVISPFASLRDLKS